MAIGAVKINRILIYFEYQIHKFWWWEACGCVEEIYGSVKLHSRILSLSNYLNRCYLLKEISGGGIVFQNGWSCLDLDYLVLIFFPANAGDIRDLSSTPGLGRFPGGGNGNPHHYSCLENPMDRGPWQATVHRVAKSWTWLKWLSTQAYKWYRMIFVFHCLIISFSMMISRSICVAANHIVSFLWLSNIPLYISTILSLSIHCWWTFGCFCVLTGSSLVAQW